VELLAAQITNLNQDFHENKFGFFPTDGAANRLISRRFS